ncbi:MAG: TIR domain-containing protein [Ktedonobacteraceae bacterium]|nr:TIR domain-containing protein [Ktedonobacteraceae bacterium]
MEKAPEFVTPLSVFISCASTDEDEVLLQKFEKHLALLKKQGIIMPWHHRKTLVGMNKQQEHDKHLESASLIILLISADFLASDDCNREMELALARQEEGVLVIPVLLHPVDLYGAPIETLLCLPRDQRPVALWENKDAAFTTIVAEIRTTIEEYLSPQQNKVLSEKERRLHALIADHNGFLKDRLESFVGRQQELIKVQEKINQRLQTGGYVTITGHAGQGKSSIIAKLIEIYGVEQVAYHFIPINPGPDHQVGLLRNLMARLILKYKLSDLYVASDNRAALRDYFPKALTDVANQGGQEIIFVDGLDQLEEDFNGIRDLSFLPTNPPAGIVFVLGTRPNDAMKPLELLKPHDEYRLPNLSRQDFDRILQHRHVSLKQVVADQFYRIMGENALYLDLVAKELIAYDAIDSLSIITHVTANPANIFSLSLERLKRQGQLWERVIYPVLGILLTAQEPMPLLCMKDILQVEDYKLRDGIAKLGGLVTEDAQRRYSLFHLKLRDYLRQDAENLRKEYIFSIEEEEGQHAHLAEWCERDDLTLIWQDSSDLKEQGRRKYARQHYITHLYYAHEWQQLFTVLDGGSYGHAKERCNLSTRSYVQDLDRGRQAAAKSGVTLEDMIAMLPRLWCYTLLRSSLRSRADLYPQEMFQLFLILGREQEVLGLAELLTDPIYKVKVLVLIAEHMAGQPERGAERVQIYFRASEIFGKMEEGYQQDIVFSILVSSLTKAELWEQAEEVAHSIEKDYPQAELLNARISALAKAGLWEQAEEVAHSIEKGNQRVEALSAFASMLAKAELWKKAEQLWAEAEEVAHSIEKGNQRDEALSAFANSLAKARQWKRAEAVTQAIEGSYQRINMLSVLISALVEAQLWSRAKEVAHSIEIDDPYVCNIAVSALAEVHLWTEAGRAAHTIEEDDQRAKALSALAGALAKAELWIEAEKLWAETEEVAHTIKESTLQAEVLSILAISLAKAQHEEHARMICIEAERLIYSIDDDNQKIKALSALASSLANVELWIEAEEVAYAIEESYPRAEALSALVGSLAKAQQWKQAEEIVCAIEESYPRAEALSALASSLAKAQQWDRTEKVIYVIEDITHLMTGSDPRTWALKAFGIALAKAQQWDRAEEFADTIDDDYLQILVLEALITSLAEAQQWDRAEEMAHVIRKGYLQVNTLSALGRALARAELWEKAEKLWEEIEEFVSTIKDDFERFSVLNTLVSTFAEVQQWDRAEKAVHAIGKGNQQDAALSILVNVLAGTQQWDRAEEIVHAIEGEDRRAKALSALAISLVRAKLWDQAEQLWAEAEEVAHTIDDGGEFNLRAEALRALVISLAEAQQWDRAEKVAHDIEGENRRAKALSALAISLAEAQQWDRAEEIAHTLKDYYGYNQNLMALADIFFRNHEYQRLVSLIHTSWLQVETRNDALLFFPLVLGLIPLQLEIGDAFYHGFQWVDTFLNS